MEDSKKLIQQMIAATILGIPAGGFLLGFVSCSDCGWNPLGRVFIGGIFAILTPFTFGFIPEDESGTSGTLNAWPYILVAIIGLFALMRFSSERKRRKNRNNRSTTEQDVANRLKKPF